MFHAGEYILWQNQNEFIDQHCKAPEKLCEKAALPQKVNCHEQNQKILNI